MSLHSLKARLTDKKTLFWTYVVVCGAALLAGVYVASIDSTANQWSPLWLLVLLALVAGLQWLPQFSATSTDGKIICATLMTLVVAAVLLGPAPAVFIGAFSVVVRWLIGYPMEHWRDAVTPPDSGALEKWVSKLQRPSDVLANLADYTWTPLAAGLAFQALASKPVATDARHPEFYGALAIAFAAAALLNLLFLLAASRCLDGESLWATVKEKVLPTLRSHGNTIVLTAVVTGFYLQVKVLGLAIGVWAVYVYVSSLIHMVREREESEAKQGGYRQAIEALVKAVESRDGTTGDHAGRCVKDVVELYERATGKKADDDLVFAVMIHDMGKVGIPDAILLKPGDLTPEEWVIMRQHPVIGDQIVESLEFISEDARSVVRSHHERWDGDGYPDGLIGEDIPILARCLSVVDAYDAMTSDRPYRKAKSKETARQILSECAGTQWDTRLVAIYLETLGKQDRVQPVAADTKGKTDIISDTNRGEQSAEPRGHKDRSTADQPRRSPSRRAKQQSGKWRSPSPKRYAG